MSDEYAVARAKAKVAAIERAKLSLQHALERIDHRYDTIRPAQALIEQDAVVGELPEFIVVKGDDGDGSADSS